MTSPYMAWGYLRLTPAGGLETRPYKRMRHREAEGRGDPVVKGWIYYLRDCHVA